MASPGLTPPDPASGASRPVDRGREVGPGRGAASGRPTRAAAGAGLGVATGGEDFSRRRSGHAETSVMIIAEGSNMG